MRTQQPDEEMSSPSPARMYDYFLGGTTNYQIDRDAAERGLTYAPEIKTIATANRQFLIRAIRFLAEQGVNQFLDIGSGLPTQENVHEIAQSVTPSARTVYVDNDPSVLPQAQALIIGDDRTRYIQADVRDPHGILSHPETTRHLDPAQPWAVVLCSVLHFVPDADDPYGVVYRLMEAAPSGSYLIFSHVSRTDVDPELYKILIATNSNNLSNPITYRTVEEIARFFDQPDWDLLPPGMVDVQSWQPHSIVDDFTPGRVRVLGGVARKR
ncbi:SAM-dependent methyltransferase [Nonomuraea sp. NPDC050478]|uniref:SAM-dependent methyltransferase n=1 Tax=Nonomuraea sp. NPDC050478 TaxID=3364365 RepID=UPI0037B2A939